MTREIPKIYDSRTVEHQAASLWEAGRYFHADETKQSPKGQYTIVIPPPNVTAALHLGHALNNTLQDILIRWRRMQGYNTLWMPGTDHAGIATQTVVEKRLLAEQGKRRTDFARDEFVAHVQSWKDEYEACILGQLKSMGCSCDWPRTRFTMDEVCAKAVRTVFFNLFKDGLIYRGKRLVNWDPATQTVLADDEVEHRNVQGFFWYLKYPLVEPVRVEGGVAGVPPAKLENRGQDAHDTNAGKMPATQEINKRYGRYLPHWSKEGATYAVVFRLVDSVPRDVSEQWRFQRRDIIEHAQSQGRPLTENEEKELQRLYSEKIESFLDSGYGECLLKKDDIAEIVDNSLKHFDGERYDLLAWAIMPNHIHIIVKPYISHKLDEIVHSWKSFTAKEINKRLGRKGSVWMDDYYDHLIRNDNDLNNQVNYVISNPEKAGLQNWKWYGRKEYRGQDARDTIEYVTVATTRPETMLGDTAVAMNPADPRAKYLVGKMVRLPIVGRLIPIIADEHVVLPNLEERGQDARVTDEKAKFSTGFLKVTPAHDPDDWAIGQRHDLPVINVMAPDGSISEKYGWTDWEAIKNPDVENVMGMDRFEAREAIVEWFRQENLLEDVRDYAHEIGHSYRSHVPIEPYLSDQWYIAVKKPIDRVVGVPPAEQLGNRGQDARDTNEGETPSTLIKGTDVPVNSLAGLALAPLLDGRLRFIPERYTKNYQGWLENLRDWPISRQLWWGHRIPAWKIRTDFSWSSVDGTDYFSELKKHVDDFKSAINTFIKKADTECEVAFIESRDDEEFYFYLCVSTQKGNDAIQSFKEFHESCLSGGGPVDLTSNSKIKPFEEEAFNLNKFILHIHQDEDVLDTWFSSALWPFSTMGWPDENDTLKKFYPTNVLCTAREIITLWVSRMVMMGQYCCGDIPFSDVYIHAMIQDGLGRKMSKSLGNGIDPLVAIDSHGADAMRFTLASMTTDTQDVRMPVAELELPDGRKVNSSPKFDLGRNFCNKLWNASRFAMMNLEGMDTAAFDAAKMDTTDKWILSRLAKTIASVTEGLQVYKYNEPLNEIYKFFWNDFCDWYLEWAKPRMQERGTAFQAVNDGSTGVSPVNQKHGQDARATAQNMLAFVLDQILRLLHPFVPFITEGIFQNLNSIAPQRGLTGIIELKTADSIMIAPWPERLDGYIDDQTERQIEIVQNVIRSIREVRSQYNIPPMKLLACSASASQMQCAVLNANKLLIMQLGCLESLDSRRSLPRTPMRGGNDNKSGDGRSENGIVAADKPANAAVIIVDEIQLYVHNVIDPQEERKRLQKQKEFVEKGIAPLAAKLNNENFIGRAKPEVIEQSRQKLKELQEQLAAIEKHLEELNV